MSVTSLPGFDVPSMDINSALKMVQWSREVAVQAVNNLDFADLIGNSDKFAFHCSNKIVNEGGDTLRFPYREAIDDDGTDGDEQILGNEAIVNYLYAQVAINKKVFSTKSATKLSMQQQAVPMTLIADAEDEVVRRMVRYFSEVAFRQLCGYGLSYGYNGITFRNIAPERLSGFNGYNPILSPDRTYKINGKEESALGDGDFLTLNDIDIAKAAAQVPTDGKPIIRPLGLPGGVDYILYVSPAQMVALRADPNSGALQELSRFAWMGMASEFSGRGAIWKNTGYNNGIVAIYNGVQIRVSPYVTPGIDANGNPMSNVARAVLIGANAVLMAGGYAGDGLRGTDPHDWLTMTKYELPHQQGISFAAHSMLGFSKARFGGDNGTTLGDNGVIVIPALSDMQASAKYSQNRVLKVSMEGTSNVAVTSLPKSSSSNAAGAVLTNSAPFSS